MSRLWPFLLLIAVTVGVCAIIALTLASEPQKQAVAPTPIKEWVLPARFEGQRSGVFTLGCAFWDMPQFHPYDEHNQNDGLFSLDASSINGELLAIVDGPQGTALISGTHCSLGVDWTSLPQYERPPPPDFDEEAH